MANCRTLILLVLLVNCGSKEYLSRYEAPDARDSRCTQIVALDASVVIVHDDSQPTFECPPPQPCSALDASPCVFVPPDAAVMVGPSGIWCTGHDYNGAPCIYDPVGASVRDLDNWNEDFQGNEINNAMAAALCHGLDWDVSAQQLPICPRW